MHLVQKIHIMVRQERNMPEGDIDKPLEPSKPAHTADVIFEVPVSESSAVLSLRKRLENPITRRRFLGAMFGAGGAAGLGIRTASVSASQDVHTDATPTALDDHSDVSGHTTDEHTGQLDAGHESEHHKISKANLTTALGVVSLFGTELGLILSGKVHGFNGKTTLANNAAESARLAVLSFTDREALAHDFKEIRGSYPLVPVLVALAEGASNLKVANDEIYKDHTKMKAFIEEIATGGESRIIASESSRRIDGEKQNTQSNGNGAEKVTSYHGETYDHDAGQETAIDFDDLDVTQDLEAWEGYLELVQQDVIDSLSQNAATTAIFAPISTTYTSSAIADENHKNIYKHIARLRYVKEVIDVKRHQVSHRSSEYMDRNQVDQLQNDAQEKALNIMNGFGGYNHLSLTLASNANGMALIGDPPMLFYLQRHGPAEFAELSAKGFTVSEFSELVLTYAFLKRAGVDVKIPEYTASYFANQGKTLRKIGQSFRHGSLADVSFNGGRKTSKDVTKLLEALGKDGVSEDVRNDLIAKMHETPEPSIFIDPRTLVQNKLERIEKWRITQKTKKMAGSLMGAEESAAQSDIEHYMKVFESGELEDFVSYFASDEYKDMVENDEKGSIKAALNALQLMGAKKESSKLTALLESLVLQTHPESNKSEFEDDGDTTVPPIDVLMDSLTNINVSSKGKPSVSDLFAHLLSITPEEFEQYEKDLKADKTAGSDEDIEGDRLDEEKVQKIKDVYDNFNVLDRKDVREALEDALLLAEKEESVHDEETFLSESAKEVTYALGSQLPIVPSWVVASEYLLEKTMGTEGELTREAVLNQTSALLAEGAVFSATADNVAAYLFVETVMESIMINYYGEEFYRSNHELQEIVWTSSAMIAMGAGANSKYGNGPNLLKHEFDKDLKKNHISLGTSFKNPYAISQTAIIGLALRNRIAANMPEKVQV